MCGSAQGRMRLSADDGPCVRCSALEGWRAGRCTAGNRWLVVGPTEPLPPETPSEVAVLTNAHRTPCNCLPTGPCIRFWAGWKGGWVVDAPPCDREQGVGLGAFLPPEIPSGVAVLTNARRTPCNCLPQFGAGRLYVPVPDPRWTPCQSGSPRNAVAGSRAGIGWVRLRVGRGSKSGKVHHRDTEAQRM
jgi:hypothetical protein